MLSKPLEDMVPDLARFTEARNWTRYSHNQVVPIQPGGTVVVARHGTVVSRFTLGKRSLWAGVDGFRGQLLPPERQEAATVDTIYDMASLTKLLTTVEALRCVDDGLVDLDGPVVSWLPRFAARGKGAVTLRQLLTHTSGLAPDPDPGLYNTTAYPTYASRIAGILEQPLQNETGRAYVYSDLNFMTLMLVIEAVRGTTLDRAIGVWTAALGMNTTYFNRGNVEGVASNLVAPQEFQADVMGPGRGEPERPQPVRGSVHDENAYALEGVGGHAGLFSTVDDTARFCQMILNNGTYGGRRILSRAAVDLVFTNFNARFPGQDHGIGFELNQYYTAGPMANPLSASHTGFTGTSLVIDRASGCFLVFLANRVHPSRKWASNNIVRQTLGAWVAKALGMDVQFPA
ncbi:beta-lactamase [Hirsutella rhossiliensis]